MRENRNNFLPGQFSLPLPNGAEAGVDLSQQHPKTEFMQGGGARPRTDIGKITSYMILPKIILFHFLFLLVGTSKVHECKF